jgi:hypothetical protein
MNNNSQLVGSLVQIASRCSSFDHVRCYFGYNMWCSLIHNVQSGISVSWGEESANIVTIDHEGHGNECSKVFRV